ncbi:MAG: hypothetical protein WKF77_20640 [Planctomycetaceae bacterium]
MSSHVHADWLDAREGDSDLKKRPDSGTPSYMPPEQAQGKRS